MVYEVVPKEQSVVPKHMTSTQETWVHVLFEAKQHKLFTEPVHVIVGPQLNLKVLKTLCIRMMCAGCNALEMLKEKSASATAGHLCTEQNDMVAMMRTGWRSRSASLPAVSEHVCEWCPLTVNSPPAHTCSQCSSIHHIFKHWHSVIRTERGLVINTRQYSYLTSDLHWRQKETQQRFQETTMDNWLAQIMKEHRRWQFEEKWFVSPAGITPTALQTLIGKATLGSVRKNILSLLLWLIIRFFVCHLRIRLRR